MATTDPWREKRLLTVDEEADLRQQVRLCRLVVIVVNVSMEVMDITGDDTPAAAQVLPHIRVRAADIAEMTETALMFNAVGDLDALDGALATMVEGDTVGLVPLVALLADLEGEL